MADGDPGVVGDDSLVQRQNSLVPGLQPPNLKSTKDIKDYELKSVNRRRVN